MNKIIIIIMLITLGLRKRMEDSAIDKGVGLKAVTFLYISNSTRLQNIKNCIRHLFQTGFFLLFVLFHWEYFFVVSTRNEIILICKRLMQIPAQFWKCYMHNYLCTCHLIRDNDGSALHKTTDLTYMHISKKQNKF